MEALSKDELQGLLEQAWAARKRDWLMILVAYSHGLRASEVVALTRDNLRDGFLTVKRLKGSLATTQPLMTSANPLFDERDALIDYVQSHHRNQRLFPVSRQHFWRLVQKYAAWAGIPAHKRHPHILKHSIAMQSIEKAGIENVRQYLGHKSMSSTGEYLKVNDSEASAAISSAVNRVPQN